MADIHGMRQYQRNSDYPLMRIAGVQGVSQYLFFSIRVNCIEPAIWRRVRRHAPERGFPHQIRPASAPLKA